MGSSKTVPGASSDVGTNGSSFGSTIWPLLRAGQLRALPFAHGAATPQSPFFASADVNEAYAAARAKINLDTPANSRLVRAPEGRESTTAGPPAAPIDAAAMLAQSTSFVDGIPITPVDPTW